MKRARLFLLRLHERGGWLSVRIAWGPLFAAGSLSVAATGISALSMARLGREELATRGQMVVANNAREQRQRSVDGQAEQAMGPSDFVQRLPGSINLQPILSALQRSASQASVAFAGVLIQERPGTSELLSRVDLSVSLRGSYPKLIQVLAETLSRYPNATLTRASLRRAASPDQVEATMIIALWGSADAMPRATNETTLQADLGSAPTSAGR